jgi:polysaccharide deacetylase 2 family uncharacterized protein YibQ
MTKRRNMDGPSSGSSKSNEPGPVAFALALIVGVVLALLAGTNADPDSTFAKMTESLPRVWPQLLGQPRDVMIRAEDWRGLLSNKNDAQKKSASLDDRPVVAIVIDDLGADVTHTKQALALPPEVTTSFLPYPERSSALSHDAYVAGHEVLVHLPMQPVGNENPGPSALVTGLSPEEIKQRLAWALSRVSDYDGVNNHMGSRFTASRADLIPVMQELKSHDLFFLDSRTTEKTKAADVARETGVVSASRDVFLDDEQSATAVEKQLLQVEEFAHKNGSAIAIGHPHAETLAVLASWVKTLNIRGVRLVPVSEVVKLRQANKTVSALGSKPHS